MGVLRARIAAGVCAPFRGASVDGAGLWEQGLSLGGEANLECAVCITGRLHLDVRENMILSKIGLLGVCRMVGALLGSQLLGRASDVCGETVQSLQMYASVNFGGKMVFEGSIEKACHPPITLHCHC